MNSVPSQRGRVTGTQCRACRGHARFQASAAACVPGRANRNTSWTDGLPVRADRAIAVQVRFRGLTDEDKARLDKAAETLQRLHWISGTIEGYTDATGKVDYNLKLSEQRATTVRDYLLSKGVGDERMTVVGYGETKPIADNATEEGRVQNRRVVLRRRDCDEPK
jgi:hypothetical protein